MATLTDAQILAAMTPWERFAYDSAPPTLDRYDRADGVLSQAQVLANTRPAVEARAPAPVAAPIPVAQPAPPPAAPTTPAPQTDAQLIAAMTPWEKFAYDSAPAVLDRYDRADQVQSKSMILDAARPAPAPDPNFIQMSQTEYDALFEAMSLVLSVLDNFDLSGANTIGK